MRNVHNKHVKGNVGPMPSDKVKFEHCDKMMRRRNLRNHVRDIHENPVTVNIYSFIIKTRKENWTFKTFYPRKCLNYFVSNINSSLMKNFQKLYKVININIAQNER